MAELKRRSLATLLATQRGPDSDPLAGSLPWARVHASGGRDAWSEPLERTPEDEEAALLRALGEVLDPELPVSLVDLGLVYGAAFSDGAARVDLTFTATACPCMDFIKQDVHDRLAMEPWVRTIEIREVWDPPWTTARITPEGRERLRRFGVGA